MTIAGVLEKHGLTHRDVAAGTGIALSAVSDILNNKRSPRTDTVNRLLSFLRRYEKGTTPGQLYERLFFREAA